MSFHEKSLWGSMLAVTGVYGIYFVIVLMALGQRGEIHLAEFIVLNIGAVIALVVIQVVYHVLIAVTSVREEGQNLGEVDERDRDIARRAAVPSGVLLAVGTMLAIVHLTIGSATDSGWFSTMVTANILLLSLVAAQILEYALQVTQYRRAA